MANTMMGEVIEYLARELVDHPEEVRVTELEDGDRVSIRLDVAEDDWGKVIGKAAASRVRSGPSSKSPRSGRTCA